MRRVVFINRFYWPEETATAQLLTDLAGALAAGSFTVEVLTARTQTSLPARETHQGVAIRRLGAARSTGTRVTGKLFDYVRFLASVFWHLLWRHRKGDTLVALSDPPLLGATVWLATLWRKRRIIHWVQDIYPEIAIELGGPRWLKALRPWRNTAWRRAAMCVVPSHTMRIAVTSAGVAPERAIVCSNWALRELQPTAAVDVRSARMRLGFGDEFVAAYSGNLGRVHELECLLDVAEQLRDESRFRMVFIGQGAQRPRLEARAAQKALRNVRFIDAQPRHLLAETLSAAEVHFVTLKPGAERWVFPSKLSGIVAAGRPVIFVGACDSEVASLITSHGWGRCFSPDRIADLAEELRGWMRNPDRHRHHVEATQTRPPDDFAVALNQWMALLDPAMPHPERPPGAQHT